jgi:outer membrane receptor protein involved in Fe transport
VSSYADRQLPAPERTSVPGYALLGASARLQLRPGLVLTVRGDNLLDREYETYIGFPGPGRALRAGLAWARP